MDSAKPVIWVGPTRDDLRAWPIPVRRRFGHALFTLQQGRSPPSGKPLKGIHGVLEVSAAFDGNAYGLIVAPHPADAVYVLHVFQKRSHRGISTPAKDIAVIRSRLRRIGGR
ncbi:MAG: type II toxin-antitoxin system RelE/ParE family toxin [Trueperaceae bacterium]